MRPLAYKKARQTSISYKCLCKQGKVLQACNPRTLEMEAEYHKFKASLGYRETLSQKPTVMVWDVAQWVEHLPSIHRALGSSPGTELTRHGGTCL